MAKVIKKIKELMKNENLTLKQALEKYPHLAEMHFEDLLEEDSLNEKAENKKDLLLG